MSKKSKGLILGSTPLYEDAKSRLKHQSLMQDFQELEKETDDMRSKLEAAKQRKLTIAAEVRFLRRKYKCLVKTKIMNLSEEQRLVHLPKSSLKQTKTKKKQHRLLPPVPEPKSKKKRYTGEELPPPSTYPVINQYQKKLLHGGNETTLHSSTPSSILNQYGRINIRKENFAWNTPVLDLNQKETIHIAAFDLNQASSSPSGKEASSFPTLAPIFDLNEISVCN